MNGNDLLGHLFALDEKAMMDGITKDMCFELQVLIDEILKLDGFDKARLDRDLVYCCNQADCTSFIDMLDKSIRALSEYVHPVPDYNMLY